MATHQDWKWYASGNGEDYHIGPYSTRDEVLAEGASYYPGSAFYVIEACKDYVDIARYISAETIIEVLGERIDEDCGDPEGANDPLLDPTPSATRALEAMLRNEVRRWQEMHDIRIEPWTFTATRNEEVIQPASSDRSGEAAETGTGSVHEGAVTGEAGQTPEHLTLGGTRDE